MRDIDRVDYERQMNEAYEKRERQDRYCHKCNIWYNKVIGHKCKRGEK